VNDIETSTRRQLLNGGQGIQKSMTGRLRVTGVFLFLVSIMRLLALIGTPPH